MEKTRNKNLAIVLLFALVLSLVAPQSLSLAASKPKLSSSKATFYVGKTKTVKVKCGVAGKISVKSLNPYFCGVKKVKKTLKKNSPASFTLKGLCAGYSIIAVHVKLKKKVKGSKEFDLRFHAYTKDKPEPTPTATPWQTATPSPTPTATSAATATPTASASATPTATPKATATAKPTPTKSATPTPSVTPSPTPTATPVPTPTPDPDNYTVTFTHNLGKDEIITGMPDPLVVKVPKNGDHKLTLPTAPSCEGHYFEAWIYLNDYRKSPGAVVDVTKDMSIKAYFKSSGAPTGPIIQYETGSAWHPEIRGVINGKRLYSYGGSIKVTSIIPSWEGHVFLGWQISGYGTLYHAGDIITNINSDMTLYAAWDPPS